MSKANPKQSVVQSRRKATAKKREVQSAARILEFYTMKVNEIEFGCNEFDDVKIVVWNERNPTKAKQRVREFIAWISGRDCTDA